MPTDQPVPSPESAPSMDLAQRVRRLEDMVLELAGHVNDLLRPPGRYEYRTTLGRVHYPGAGYDAPTARDPQPPRGRDWTLVSTCVAGVGKYEGDDGGYGWLASTIVWTWSRPLRVKAPNRSRNEATR